VGLRENPCCSSIRRPILRLVFAAGSSKLSASSSAKGR
jgi:hypothetical protein